MISSRANQPGALPIDVPEQLPNPAHVPARPAPAPTPQPREPARVPEKVSSELAPALCWGDQFHFADNSALVKWKYPCGISQEFCPIPGADKFGEREDLVK